MIHYKLQPPHCAKCTLNSMWHMKKQSFSLHLHLLPCKITANVLLSLSFAERAHQHQQRSQEWPFLLTVNHAMWRETGRKRKKEGIKILDEEPGVLPAQSVHLLSPGRLELPAHHATQTDKLPPLAPPHNLVCHHSRHVPRACFSYLCGNMKGILHG